jgi:integrase
MASGSIQKHVAKDGTITWRVRVDVYDPSSGKRRQPQRTYKTKREAEKGLREWLSALEQGTAVDRSAQTVASYLEYWLAACAAHRVKAATLDSYRRLIVGYIIPALGALPLQGLTAARLQSFYAAMLSPGGGRSGAALSSRTVRYMHTLLHGALAEALRLGLVARNVSEAVRPPKPVRYQAAAWGPADVQRFLQVAQRDDLWPLWLLAVHTGLRRSEVLGVRWRDLDLGDGRSGIGDRDVGQAEETASGPTAYRLPPTACLVVRHSAVLVGNDLRLQDGAKRGGHTVALSSVCVAALRAHRARQLETRLELGPLWEDHDLVFTGVLGRPIHPTTLGRRFRALVKEAGLPPLTFHGLRHTHATILMLAGVHPKVVSERLGHADIGITLQTYSHVLPQMQAQAAEVFAAAVAQQEQAQ